MSTIGFGMGGFDAGFGLFSILFVIVFIIIIVVFVVAAVKGLSQWRRNNESPVLTVEARVVTKRTDVSRSMHSDADGVGSHSHSSTWYYVTFEVESGDRMELAVGDSEYGMLVEGDRGKLTFQGTRYQGFQRERQS